MRRGVRSEIVRPSCATLCVNTLGDWTSAIRKRATARAMPSRQRHQMNRTFGKQMLHGRKNSPRGRTALISMDHHTLAAVSITGTCLDVVGSLYLAYDLLGGQHGPLRLLTRAVTYSLVFVVGYGLGLGLFFGVPAGVATGITMSIELNRAARGLDHYGLPWEGVFAAIRGFAVGAGLYSIVGFGFAASFAALITIGQILAYSRGMRPALDYTASRRPRLTRRQFWGSVVRTIGYIASALACSAFIH